MNTDFQAFPINPVHHLLMELLFTATFKAGNCTRRSWAIFARGGAPQCPEVSTHMNRGNTLRACGTPAARRKETSFQKEPQFFHSFPVCLDSCEHLFLFILPAFTSKENHWRMTLEQRQLTCISKARLSKSLRLLMKYCYKIPWHKKLFKITQFFIYKSFLFNCSLVLWDHLSNLHMNKTDFKKCKCILRETAKYFFFSLPIFDFFLPHFLFPAVHFEVKGIGLVWRHYNFSIFCSFSCGKMEKEIK